jgi:hypothetical protein
LASPSGAISATPGSPITDGYAKLAYDWFNNGPGISLNTDLAFSVPFTFGTAFSLGVWMNSSLGVGQYGSPGTIQHNATNTLSWNGITSIEDTTTSTTVDPGDYTAFGDSGMNWIQPVPEPTSALLLAGSGLLLLARPRAEAPTLAVPVVLFSSRRPVSPRGNRGQGNRGQATYLDNVSENVA